MATIVSRVRGGVFKLGPTASSKDFAGQLSSSRIEPVPTTEDEIESLSGTVAPGGTTIAWQMVATVIQDFASEAGLVAYTITHAAEEVEYEWSPGPVATHPTYKGKLTMIPVAAGGDVGATLTSDVTWPLSGAPEITYPAAAA